MSIIRLLVVLATAAETAALTPLRGQRPSSPEAVRVSGAGPETFVLIAGMVGDAADLSATLAAGRRVPLAGRALVAVLAGAGIAMGAGALRG